MKILGIDPGSRITGFGLIEKGSDFRKWRYIASGLIRRSSNDSLARRIDTLAHSIQEVINHYDPHEVVIEQVFINTNAAASLVLGQARGGIMAAVSLMNRPIYEYSALQVKKAVVGRGKAQKSQVQLMVKEMLSLNHEPSSDAADALAVALTHGFYSEHRLSERSGGQR